MERVTFKILFYVKKTRIAKNGEVPVMLRVTVNGQRAETSVNLKINPKFWNVIAGKSRLHVGLKFLEKLLVCAKSAHIQGTHYLCPIFLN